VGRHDRSHSGRVLDGKKQPLAGVTVGMVGVPLGAISDETGAFTILNIPAGAYTVRASLVGYRAVTTTNIIVSADEATRLDLVLEEAPVQMQEVVVSAKRPVVEIHRTSTVAIVPREDIQKLPVQELQGRREPAGRRRRRPLPWWPAERGAIPGGWREREQRL
jgi:hypothetical protein